MLRPRSAVGQQQMFGREPFDVPVTIDLRSDLAPLAAILVAGVGDPDPAIAVEEGRPHLVHRVEAKVRRWVPLESRLRSQLAIGAVSEGQGKAGRDASGFQAAGQELTARHRSGEVEHTGTVSEALVAQTHR